MLRGVNKRMIEITETGNDAFERVFVVLREGLDSRTAEALGEEAGRYARELACSHRNRRQEAALPFVSPRPAPAGRGTLATAVRRKTRRGRGFWLAVLALSLLVLAAALTGLILWWPGV